MAWLKVSFPSEAPAPTRACSADVALRVLPLIGVFRAKAEVLDLVPPLFFGWVPPDLASVRTGGRAAAFFLAAVFFFAACFMTRSHCAVQTARQYVRGAAQSQAPKCPPLTVPPRQRH